MAILLYGLNHVSAPLEVRERVAVPPGDLEAVVGRLVGLEEVDEGLIVSTCNRTELLVRAREDDAGACLRRFLANERGVSEEELERHCYLHTGPDAVRHVFRVASSLDSMIVGEAQILGQVKEAYTVAIRAGGCKKVLDALMQRAFAVAKKVRTETGVARSSVSIAHAAARLARDIFGDLSDRSILVLGAGEMGGLAARHLISGGVRSLVVVNRSYQRAVELARELGGRASPLDRLFEQMDLAYVVVASTAAPNYVVTYEDGLRLRKSRRGRPLFLIDIAVPRNIDPRLNELDDVYLYDIDELGDVVQTNLEERRKEEVCAEAIVEQETAAYLGWLRTLQVAPMIVDLRKWVHDLGAEELQRFHGRFAALTPQQRRLIEEFTTALINKILHRPIQALKQAAAKDGQGLEIDLLRTVFGLTGDRAPSRTNTPLGPSEDDASGTPPTKAEVSAPSRGRSTRR